MNENLMNAARFEMLSEFLGEKFVWDDTKNGYDFWKAVHDAMREEIAYFADAANPAVEKLKKLKKVSE